jgi:antitoxin MazE
MKSAILTIKQWGNSLGVRIPAAVARAAKIELDQPVQVIADEGRVIITPIGTRKLSLADKLARFDPTRHGGEAMATRKVGAEAM